MSHPSQPQPQIETGQLYQVKLKTCHPVKGCERWEESFVCIQRLAQRAETLHYVQGDMGLRLNQN